MGTTVEKRWEEVTSYLLNSPTVRIVIQPKRAIFREVSDDARAWNNMYDVIFACVCAPRLLWESARRNETVGACASKFFCDAHAPSPLQTQNAGQNRCGPWGRPWGLAGRGLLTWSKSIPSPVRDDPSLNTAGLIRHAAFTLPCPLSTARNQSDYPDVLVEIWIY